MNSGPHELERPRTPVTAYMPTMLYCSVSEPIRYALVGAIAYAKTLETCDTPRRQVAKARFDVTLPTMGSERIS